MSEAETKCPKCGSTQLKTGKRGWTIWMGLIGANTIISTCLKCGHKFKPAKEKK